MRKSISILIIIFFVVQICVISPVLAKNAGIKSLLQGHVYELKSQGFINGLGVMLDLEIDVDNKSILIKKADVKANPLGELVHKTNQTEEIPLKSILRKGSSVLVEGYEGEDTGATSVKIRLFVNAKSKSGFSGGQVDLQSSVNETGDMCRLCLDKIRVDVVEAPKAVKNSK